jgi:competence protein ComEA
MTKDIRKSQTRRLVQLLLASFVPAAAWAGPVNVNTADAATIAKELDGIGPAKAQAIVDYRQANGPYRSAEDLLKVDGIGQRVLDQNRGNIRLDRAGGAPAASKAAPARKQAAAPASGG